MTVTPPGKVRRTLRIIAGWFMLGAFAFWFCSFFTEESRVREICAQVQPGMTLSSLRDFAIQHSMRKPATENGTDFMLPRKTFRSYGCTIHMENGVVRAAEYSTSK